MNLDDQNKLVEYFVKREPDTTIKDFLEAVKEYDRVSRTVDEYEYHKDVKRFSPKNQIQISDGKIYSTQKWQEDKSIKQAR